MESDDKLLNKKRKEETKSKSVEKKIKNPKELVEKINKSDKQSKKLDKYKSKILGDDKENLFVSRKISNFSDIFEKSNNKIKSMIIDENGIISKLNLKETSFDYCTRLARRKINDLNKIKDINEIYHILSYDNTDQYILYFCLKKLKKLNKNEFEKAISLYKYCFSNNIILNGQNKEKLKKDISKKFEINCYHEDLNSAINNLSNFFKSLIDFSYTYKKVTSKNIYFKFKHNINGDELKLSKKNTTELGTKGLEFLKYNIYLKKFGTYNNNQPFNYEKNIVLYINYIINEIYKYLISESEDKLFINDKYLELTEDCNEIIKSIIGDLQNNIINSIFIIKIKFIFLLLRNLEHKYEKNIGIYNYDKIIFSFVKHLIVKPLNKNDLIKKIKEYNQNNYTKIKYDEFNEYIKIIISKYETLTFKYNEYNYNLINSLDFDQILRYTWEKNSLSSFQIHNYNLENDLFF